MNRSNLSGSAAKAVSRSRAPEVDRSLMTQSLATSLKIALPQRSSGLRGSARRSDCCTVVPPPANGEHCPQAVKLALTANLAIGGDTRGLRAVTLRNESCEKVWLTLLVSSSALHRKEHWPSV